ncbi:radical SAM protein [Prodigiosinella confusarubida]|uniref:Radical SAM protein n=1 Tax=Serratia sp. (strain ATCC 39006) TaxID=104623 RepID=A0A2I5THT4_SERS3|nr:radical SAM protein [Serratia sp. ATCC 39006]AUG99806.1 radical SAM protein [Serratia sp. ATCC 39006]AUH04125.1 radical SAM protein [Serratia sp. ATCC 39006]
MNNHILASLDDRYLELTIMPTEQCNFRCVYCYEDFAIGNMRNEVADSINKFVDNALPRLRKLNILWFGGEPLLALRQITKISSHIKYSAKQNNVEYTSSMTTNGYYLTLKNLTALVNLNITSYQITLDGYAEYHDKMRKKSNGKGSFQTIWHNLMEARRSTLNFNIILRVHYSPDNIHQTITLIERINKEFSNDHRFTIFFHSIERLGGDNDDNITIFNDKKEKLTYLSELLKLIQPELIFQSVNNNYICYAAKLNSFVIRPNGDVLKCTVALNSDVNSIGHLNKDGLMTLDIDKVRAWSIPLFTENEKDLECPSISAHKLWADKSTIPVTNII